MLPVITEIEDVFEGVPGLRFARDFEFGVVVPDEIGFVFVVGVADQPAVGELELVQV